MKERNYASVTELFTQVSPELLPFLDSGDPVWARIKDNSITDRELDLHESLLAELGISPHDSAFAKAVQIVKDFRKSSLPTPVNFTLGPI